MEPLDRTVAVAGIRGLRGQPGVGADGIGEEAIAEFFAFDCGQVLSVRIAGDVVYVEFADVAGVHRGLQKDRTESGGHLLRITPARPAGAAKQINGAQLPPAGQLGGRGEWFPVDNVADDGVAAGVGAFAGMPAADKSRGAMGHVPGAGIMSQGQAFAPPFAGQQLPFGGGYQQYQGAFTPGFGNSGFPPADGGGFGASAFQGTLAPAQARESFTPYGAGVYAPAPPQQYAAPFSAPVPAAQKGPISYAAVAAAGVPPAGGVAPPPIRAAPPVQHHQPAPVARSVPRAFGGGAHANDRVAAVAATVAASKLPLAAAISSVNQQVGGLNKRDSTYTSVLKMRGLPFSADKGDILRFFEAERSLRLSKPLTEDSIHIVTEPSGRPAGIAFVEFSTAEEAKSVVQLRNRKMMGSRYVELFPSSRDEATRVATGASKW